MNTLQEVDIASDEYMLSHKPSDKMSNRIFHWDKTKGYGKDPAKENNSYKSRSPLRSKKSSSKGGRTEVECYFCHQRGYEWTKYASYKKHLDKVKKSISLLAGKRGVKGENSHVLDSFGEYISEGEVFADNKKE